MEKDKGIFSFRKHPVGELPGGKKERKRKESWPRGANARKMHRALGMLMAAALVFNTLPVSGLAVSASEQGTGLCEHHRSHTAECGYVCEICNGTEPEDTGENTENTEDAGTDTAECICKVLCAEDSSNGDCPVCGADDASLLDCKGKVSEENTGEQEDTGICKHHQEHDADCGYIPKSEDGEGSPCTYECRICPVEDLIAALPDTVTEDNAEEVRAQLEEILALYRELDEDEQEQIDLSRCYALQEALDNANAPMTADGRTDQQVGDEASVTIGGETLYYATLEEAFDAANGKTATITMLNDSECVHSDSNGSPLNITGGNVTLDMNGKTLSGMGYGYYGIINVSGGSLLVEGEGEIWITGAGIGLFCSGSGKLTVEDITLNFIVGTYYAYAGVANQGGTVILNGTQMTGAASDGQIYHYSGTTTINNVTATGATESNPKSVYYHSEGTLKINGGTFDEIAVGSGNYGGVTSVAELLGEGCAYKKQDGTWATDDELAGLEISNVTVEKIPLTIHPQGDTSWYYSTQQTHTLEMNAAPVSSDNSVTYVWKSGVETLECTSDACIVSAGTPVGSYNYTCEATCDGYTLSHTFTFKIEQSGTEFTGGIKTYNGSEETTSFSADDTITVKAAPTAAGAAQQKAAARLRGSYTEPTAGQMALFVGDVQVSEPVEAGADGTYIMTVSATEVLLKGNAEPNGDAITLTAKFVGNDNMAGAAGTVDVRISAVAMAELDGTVIGYYGESNLADAFADSGNADATFTLLADVEPSTYLAIQIDCTLDLNGHTITSHIGRGLCVIVETNTAVTIRGEGEIIAKGGIALAVNGSVTLEGGTYTSGGDESSSVYVMGQSAMLSVSGEKVSIRNTSGGYGLSVAQAQSVRLSAGTYSGTAEAISSTVKLSDMLAHTDNIRYAFYQGDALVTTGLDGQALTGTVTVKACTHTYQYAHTTGTTTHSQTCPACGDAKDSEECDFSNGSCPCGAVLAVKLPADLNLTYTGTTQEPGVTVTVDGTPLTEGYSVAYNNNINAGNAAAVTITGTSFTGTATLTFSIGKATPTITWSSTTQELTYTGQQAVITEPTVTLLNNENFKGTISYSYKKEGETAYKDGLPTDAGTYAVKAHVDAAGNYTAADSTDEMTLTISYMDAPGLQYNDSDKKDYYNRDVAVKAVSAGGHTYTVSDTLGGDYKASYTISAQEGTVTKTLYFKDEAGHMSDGVEVTVKFDLTPPTGEIAVGMKWWQNVLNFVSFGNYAAKEYTVTIKAEDKNGSGIDNDKIEYVIVTGSSQYTDADTLAKANLSWTEYNSGSKPTVPVSNSQYVVYARLTDNVGNVTYISTDGILLDSTAPTVDELAVPEETKKDVTAGFTFTVSEAADYYYVVLPQDSAAPSAGDIIVTCGGTLPGGRTGIAIADTVDSGKGAASGDTFPASVSAEAKNLQPNTAYSVYVTAVDRALDITDSAEGTPAGNIAAVLNAGFTTKKTLPVIAKAPVVTGTYGQSVGEMTITGGTAQAGNTVLTGTWTVSDTDKGRIPFAGTTEEVTVIFTPDDDSYDSVSVQALLEVEQAEPDVGTVTAGTLEDTLDVGKVALSRTNQTLAGTLTLTESTLKYGTNTYTWKFTPDDTNYKPVTGKVQITVNDTIPPTAEYRIGTDGWKQFIHNVPSGLSFCKGGETVEIRGTDDTDTVAGSGISLTQYYISGQEITDTDSIAWNTYKEPASLNAPGTYLIYVKVTDHAGNTAVLSSEGIVVYAESALSPAAFDYTYKENHDCTVQLAMNGNTFRGLTDGEGNAIDTASYSIDSNDMLTLKAAYLDTLDQGGYTYTVSMNPQGIDTDQVTLAYTFTVNVKAKELTVTGAEAADRAYDGTDTVEITAVTLGGAAPEDEVTADLSGIHGTLSSANAGMYTEVTLPELTLTGADSGNYTLVQPAAAVPTSVTIAPLDAVITVGTDTYHKTFGDAAFTLDVTDNNTEADVQYEVTKGTDVAFVEKGAVIIRNAGMAEIRVSLPASTNYTAAENKTITVTVNKKSGYTIAALNRSYYYQDGGTDNIDLAALLPKDCGNVAYGEPAVSGDVSYSAAPAMSGGGLSYTLNSGNADDGGIITVTVATRNYEDIQVTVNVKLAGRISVSLKTGTEVTLKNNVLTYGEPLSDLIFNEAEFVTADQKTVAGTLAWKEPAAVPAAGTAGAAWIFTPEEDKYEPVEGIAGIRVNKAPYAPGMPDSTMAVSDSIEKVGDIPLPEGWEWQAQDQDIALEDGETVSAMAVYTGADQGNYETEAVMVAITRSACDHVAGDVLYTGAGEMAPTCTEPGLGHRECTICHTVVETDIAVEALGHSYISEVTKEPTASEDGEMTYTCSRCGSTYNETIPRETPDGLWISGLTKSVPYTGSAARQESIRVYHGSTLLREKTEYTISYKNNTGAGTAQLIVTGRGNYKGKCTAEFTIEPVDLKTDPSVLATIATATETGKSLKPAVAVTWNSKKLKENKDYTLSYETGIKNASEEGYDVVISGKGNYTGDIERKFYVKPRGTKLLNKATVKGIKKSYEYQGSGPDNGQDTNPEGQEANLESQNAGPKGLASDLENITVKIGTTTLAKEDYTVRTENTDAVGTGYVVIEPAPVSSYAGEKRIPFNITGTNIKKCFITGLAKSYPYTGGPIMPEIEVYTGRNGTGTLISSDAYTVRYSNYTNQGKATVTVTGIPEKGCLGSITAVYSIGRLNLATEKTDGSITVTMPDDIKYAKGGAKPQPVITHSYNGTVRTLREGVDYMLKYSNNTAKYDSGTAAGSKKPTLKITGTGNYTGIIAENFDIVPQDIGKLQITAADKAYNSKKRGSYYYSVPKVYDFDGKLLKSGRDYTVQYTNETTGEPIGRTDTVENGTQIRVTVTAKENSSYVGTLGRTYSVRDAKDVKDISKVKNDKIAAQQYTGSAIKPEVKLYTLTGKTKNYLTEEDYEIIGYYNNIKRGNATVLIRGTGAYSGVKSITFKITSADNKLIWVGSF